ncbi:MAG: ABC transporter substrate-binding protein [Thermotogae bacterium]|jgi:peptide/nickel transport system substrate-binding protein|nr:ABC transporter substrate-binding protein [Thermotogota bacterium]MCL5032243.1 ABC transporter substrate-binding protein [Thermotogota bacterium]
MKKVGISVVVSMLILGMFIFANNVKYGGTVNLGGSAPTYMAANFNPFLMPTGSADPGIVFVYEPLMYVNPLNGTVTPLLATAYQWEDSNLKMVVTIRKSVKWNDGVPFTPEDVAFTFNLLKKYPALDSNGIWSSGLQSVEASGDYVIFTFSKPDIPMYFYMLRTLIVPAHIWSKVDDPTTFMNADNPVGTGPFLRTSYSVANNTEYFSKNPNYWWKGRPYIDGIRMIGSVSNEAAFLQMLKRETDQNDIAIADPIHTWVNKDPQNNLMFWPTANANMLIFNDAKNPFNNATFRKAISLAINKKLLEDRAYWGTGGYDISQTQIIPSQRSQWYDTSLATEDTYLNSYNPTEAQKLLESIGYTKNSAGVLVGSDGKTLPTFNILVGTGWTDFITMAQNISQELKAIGIDTNIVQQSYSTYMTLLMTGNFDMAIAWAPTVGPNPFYAYHSEFYPGFSAPLGQSAISDYTRYTNPTITKALETFTNTSDLSVQKQAMYEIEKVLIDELPVIVLTNRTGFDLYSQKTFVGWPTIENPYSMGWNGAGLGMELVALNLHLK